MNILETTLQELEDLLQRADDIKTLDQFKEALSGTKIPELFREDLIKLCQSQCTHTSPVPGLVVFSAKDTISQAIKEFKKRI